MNEERLEETDSVLRRMAKFIGSKNYKNCFDFHKSRIGEQKDLEKAIASAKDDLFVKLEEAFEELERIKTFYQKDFDNRVKAFQRQSKITVQSSGTKIL